MRIQVENTGRGETCSISKCERPAEYTIAAELRVKLGPIERDQVLRVFLCGADYQELTRQMTDARIRDLRGERPASVT